MLCEKEFKNPKDTETILKKIRALSDLTGPVRLMEICGTHTMAIARSGLKTVLPDSVRLLSGPGCPVCVTPANVIDMILDLSQTPGILIASYGDLLRVPGSRQGDNLLSRRALGGNVESVYSPMDSIRIAREHPELEVVFLGVGFETTAPGTGACIMEASRLGLENFSVLCLLKKTEPALRSLIGAEDFSVNGFLCPGHVAAVIGSDAFSFLAEDYGLPGVVAGFEPADLLCSVLSLMQMLAAKQPGLKNEYTRLVKPHGNPAALAIMDRVFRPAASEWRGLGRIEKSGFALKEEYSPWDAWKKFSLQLPEEKEIPGCRCAQVIRGVLSPSDCPLFRTVCSPENPVGPCMVSGEGACAAAFQYGN